MVCWKIFNATMNRTKYISHFKNNVARTAFNHVFFMTPSSSHACWDVHISEYISNSAPQTEIKKINFFKHLKHKYHLQYCINEYQRGTGFNESEKKYFLSPLQPCLRKKSMYLVFKQGDYSMESAYSISGVCFIHSLLI